MCQLQPFFCCLIPRVRAIRGLRHKEAMQFWNQNRYSLCKNTEAWFSCSNIFRIKTMWLWTALSYNTDRNAQMQNSARKKWLPVNSVALLLENIMCLYQCTCLLKIFFSSKLWSSRVLNLSSFLLSWFGNGCLETVRVWCLLATRKQKSAKCIYDDKVKKILSITLNWILFQYCLLFYQIVINQFDMMQSSICQEFSDYIVIL